MRNGHSLNSLKNHWLEQAKKIIRPAKGYTFHVTVVMCVHRELKVKAFRMAEALAKCPDPKIDVKIIEGDALIARSRARAAQAFMDTTDSNVLLFFDDDIYGNTYEITQMLWSLWQQNLDILGAAYAKKSLYDKHMALKLPEGDYTFGKDGGVVEVTYLSTGCMAIRRRVFEKLIEKRVMPLTVNDSLVYRPFFNPWPYNEIDNEWFQPGVSDTEKKGWLDLSEDWAFIQRCRDIGFKNYVDTRVFLQHFGTMAYSWDTLNLNPKPHAENFRFSVRKNFPQDSNPSGGPLERA